MDAALDTYAQRRAQLTRLVVLSIVASLVTITLKTVAWQLTGSVGLLSDAAESLVNLVAATFALVVVRFSTQPPDEDHAYGHEKADYLASGVEGTLIIAAAGTILYAAIDRLLNPAPVEQLGVGVAVSVAASLINLVVATVLIRAGRRLRSIVLEADGRHLLTDVWTSVGVVLAIGAVAVTGWERLDPIIALIVGANIVRTGVQLVRSSTSGLLDRSLQPDELAKIEAALAPFAADGLQFHALRTRRSAQRAFVSVHVLVPGDWTVQHGHDLAERVETAIRDALGDGTTTFTHLEPIEDPVSFADTELDRRD